jgi:hypothetical protein
VVNNQSYSLALKIFVIPSKNKSRTWSKATNWIYRNGWFGSDKEKTKVAIWILDRLKIEKGITVNSSNFWSCFDHLIKIAARNNLNPTIH